MKFLIYLASALAILQLSCGKTAHIDIPTVDGFYSPAEDTDLYPIYDRAYYERTLPADRQCRLRYTADFDYSLFAGNHYISRQTSPTYLYAALYSDEYEARGDCVKQRETCSIVKLRHGYTILINGDRINLQGEPDWEELARDINYLYRHRLCQAI